MKRTAVFCILVAVALPVTVSAEVYDKIPSQASVVVWGLAGAALSYIAARYKPFLLLPWLPFQAFLCYFSLSDLNSDDLGKDILIEMGQSYVVSVYASVLLIPLLVLAGLFVRSRQTSSVKGR